MSVVTIGQQKGGFRVIVPRRPAKLPFPVHHLQPTAPRVGMSNLPGQGRGGRGPLSNWGLRKSGIYCPRSRHTYIHTGYASY